MTIDWGIIFKSIPLLGHGVVVTLPVSALASVLGLMLGVVLGLCSLSHSRPLRWIVAG